MSQFTDCTLRKVTLRYLKQRGITEARLGKNTKWRQKLRKPDHLRDLSLGDMMILKGILKQ
jgi:hypothetical protein